ncbi:hypothetical protein BCY86_02130 [Pajaroellobacter abortibovis]|uniref:Uncharacterized protein n=2 Tax=Pajaroellobacter abortibovis TaxID=1882918 RepID=A0A1L6MVP2_9BACT|nr:hypothetical protein BCY86_02130 [Pajaroellobacter abortibovis]
MVACACAVVSARWCQRKHPYVPYKIEEILQEGEGGVPCKQEEKKLLVCNEWASFDGGTWKIQNRSVFPVSLERPLVSGITCDWQGNGVQDGFALARGPLDEGGFDILFYRIGEEEKKEESEVPNALEGLKPYVVAQVPLINPAPSCIPFERLAPLGQTALLIEVGYTCPSMSAYQKVHWFGVLRFGMPPQLRWSGAMYDPSGSLPVTVELKSRDEDRDGVEDLILRVTAESPPLPFIAALPLSLLVQWLDRPAGMSRIQHEPIHSLGILVKGLMSRASDPKQAPSVIAEVQQIRTLYGALCMEGGRPRIVGILGVDQFQCGGIELLQEAEMAEVRAFAALEKPLAMLMSLERLYKTAGGLPTLRDIPAWGRSLFSIRQAASVRLLDVVAAPKPSFPAWSSLAFDHDRYVQVHTSEGALLRVNPDTGESEVIKDKTPWDSRVLSPDGALQWERVDGFCTGAPLRAVFKHTRVVGGEEGGEELSPLELILPAVAPFKVKCDGSEHTQGKDTIPLGWTPTGLEAMVAGHLLRMEVPMKRVTLLSSPSSVFPPPFGSSRSPNGKLWIYPSEYGFLILGKGGTWLYQVGDKMRDWAGLSDCTLDDSLSYVACLFHQKLWIGFWPSL